MSASSQFTPHLYSLGGYSVLTVDMGSATELTVNFSYPHDHLRQIWLLGHQVINSSDSLLRVEMGGATGLRWRPAITNQLGGPCIFIQGAVGATLNLEKSAPSPLLEPSEYRVGGRDVAVSFKVTAANGSPVTYTRLVLFFALTAADMDKHWAYPTLGDVPHGYMGTRTY